MRKSKRQKHAPANAPSRKDVLDGIRVELRSILRQRDCLRRPLQMFLPVANRTEGEPRYCVVFDNRSRRRIEGLRIRVKTIQLPDEKIHDDILNFAQSVWHFKDRLKQWTKIQNTATNIEELANRSIHLLVCADLANQKKHGGMGNRSGLLPELDLVTFDTSRSGMIEFFYDGTNREKELLVANSVPIPYTVDILTERATKSLGNATDYICKAFAYWVPIIQQLGITSEDSGSRELVELFCRSHRNAGD